MSNNGREKLKEWAKDWANNEEIPDHAMELFLDSAEKALDQPAGIQSESLGDHSVSYKQEILTASAMTYLRPYRKVKFA